MSMDTCAECGDLVDTDDDPDCYIDMHHNGREACVCADCRHEWELENEETFDAYL